MELKSIYNDYYSKEYNKVILNLYELEAISSQSDGKINFSYTPSSIEYDLNHQQVSLYSKEGRMQANIVFDGKVQSFSLYGIVNKASISEMNLFPSFFNWYRDNIYLAPITLITTIFGGVTLMLNKKKKG